MPLDMPLGRQMTHEKVGHTGQGLWKHPSWQLPAYIQHVANDLIESGHDESRAVEMAVGIVKDWAAGHDGHGHTVSAETQAKATAAIAEWEALKARTKHGASRAQLAAAEINDLPDSAFAHIEPGGTKDGSGKTVPRSKRHLPIHDEAHIRNTLARLPQSDLPATAKAQALAKIKAAAKKKGIQVSDDSGNGSTSRVASELLRFYPLEDIHILSRAEGDGSGRVVEAYATVFDVPTEIVDHQGHYMEEIDRSAFDQVLARIEASPGGLRAAVKVLYNHGKTMEGVPAPEYQLPLGVPIEVKAEKRGLLTRTEYDVSDPFTDRILSKIRSGAITSQSFVGGIIRSTPELRGPGDRYRRRNGTLTTVRRMVLGLREYGPVLFPAYSGAEILGVRMRIPGSDTEPVYGPGDEESGPGLDGDGTAGTAEVSPSREHAHQLLTMRMKEMCKDAGIAPIRSPL